MTIEQKKVSYFRAIMERGLLKLLGRSEEMHELYLKHRKKRSMEGELEKSFDEASKKIEKFHGLVNVYRKLTDNHVATLIQLSQKAHKYETEIQNVTHLYAWAKKDLEWMREEWQTELRQIHSSMDRSNVYKLADSLFSYITCLQELYANYVDEKIGNDIIKLYVDVPLFLKQYVSRTHGCHSIGWKTYFEACESLDKTECLLTQFLNDKSNN